MNTLAKWVWFAMLVIFFIGTDIIWYILVGVIATILIACFKPEWFDKL